MKINDDFEFKTLPGQVAQVTIHKLDFFHTHTPPESLSAGSKQIRSDHLHAKDRTKQVTKKTVKPKLPYCSPAFVLGTKQALEHGQFQTQNN